MIPIPSKQSKKFNISLASDLFGNIVRTKSMDMNKKGYMSLARKPYVLYTETQDADFETPLAITNDEDLLFVVTTEHVYEINVDDSNITVTDSADNSGVDDDPALGFGSDGVFWWGDLYVSGSTSVNGRNNGSAWTQEITGLNSAYPHPLCVSEHQNYLIVGDGNEVKAYSAASAPPAGAITLETTLTLPEQFIVTWIRWRANTIYLGTRNIKGGEAMVFLWNGSGTAVQAGYGVGSEWAFSGCVYDAEATIVVVSASGMILKFAGGGFVPLRDDSGKEMAFPVYYSDYNWGSNAANSNLVGKLASRGMEARGRRIYMMVNGEINFDEGGTPTQMPDFPSGVWVADPAAGLYHKAGVEYAQHEQVTFSSLTDNTLTMAAAQVYETGDPVEVVSVGSLTGDIDTLLYYAIKVSSTQIKLALTPQQAKAGDNITITGTVTSAAMRMNNYESVGATRLVNAGGLAVIKALGMPRFIGNEVVYGADVRNAANTIVASLMSLGMGRNVGSFVTSKIEASAVMDTFEALVAKFSELNLATQEVVLKYRTKKRWGVPGRRDMRSTPYITWVDSTSFTINPKQYDFYSVEEGDEVEFVQGAAAGFTAHITDITVDSATQWTITIDETMPDVTASDYSYIHVENWVKLATISTTEDAKAALEGFKKSAIGGDGESVNKSKSFQFKCEIRGFTDIEETMDFEEVMVINQADQNYQ